LGILLECNNKGIWTIPQAPPHIERIGRECPVCGMNACEKKTAKVATWLKQFRKKGDNRNMRWRTYVTRRDMTDVDYKENTTKIMICPLMRQDENACPSVTG